MNTFCVLFKLREKLDNCRELLDDATWRNPNVDMDSTDFKLLRKIYNAICEVEDMF